MIAIRLQCNIDYESIISTGSTGPFGPTKPIKSGLS